MIEIRKKSNSFVFYNKNKELKTKNGNVIEVEKEAHAETLLKEIHNQDKLKDSNSLISLTFFSCSLNSNEKEQIINKIIELLKFDMILYRCFKEKDLLQLMNKELNPFVEKFEKCFDMQLQKYSSVIEFSDTNYARFKKYLNDTNIFLLTVLYKLAGLTKSVILSYFFVNKKINHNSLYKLSNLEYTYQQKIWGVVDEHKVLECQILKTIKDLSFFLKKVI